MLVSSPLRQQCAPRHPLIQPHMKAVNSRPRFTQSSVAHPMSSFHASSISPGFLFHTLSPRYPAR